MSYLEIILIGIGLAMDCFAVSVTCCLVDKNIRRATALKIALFFGFFQGMMPVAGWLLGMAFRDAISSFDHWIAFTILGIIGIKMIVESLRGGSPKNYDFSKLSVLISLSVATSIDALIVGMSFAFLEVKILPAVLIIGIITVLISLSGLFLGKKFGYLCGNKAGIIGGIVLVGIGTKILVEHLMHLP